MRRSEINGLCLGWSCKWSGVFNRSRTRGKVSMGRHPQPEQMDKQRPSFDHHQQKHTDSWTAFHDWKEGQTQVDILSTSGCQVSIQRTDRHMGIHSQITPYLNLSSKVFLSNKWPEYSPLWLCPSATREPWRLILGDLEWPLCHLMFPNFISTVVYFEPVSQTDQQSLPLHTHPLLQKKLIQQDSGLLQNCWPLRITARANYSTVRKVS